MRRAVVRDKARYIADADAAVAAGVWEAIQRGVTDHRDLFDVARYAAVCERRYELRHRRRLAIAVPPPPDLADQVAARVDAVRTVEVMRARVQEPNGPTAIWLQRKVTDDPAAEGMPNMVKNAGRRWAVRARSKLRAVHEVA